MKKILVGVLLGMGVLGILISYTGLGEFKDVLLQAELGWLGLGMVLKIPVMWFKSARWAAAIHQATGRPVRAAFSASMIGFAGNLILPARLGEWARLSVIDKHNHTGRTLALAALIATQLFDLVLLASCFLFFSAYATNRFADQILWAIGLVTAILFVLATLMLLRRRSAALSAWYDPVRKKMPALLNRLFTQKLQLCLRGISSLSDGRALTWILLLTFLAWGTETVSVFTVLRAFQIQATLSMVVMLVVVTNLCFLIPITPGNIGIVQAATVVLLGTFGVPPVSALAYGVAHQGLLYILIAVLGMICFYREGMNLNLLGRRAKEGALGKPAAERS